MGEAPHDPWVERGNEEIEEIRLKDMTCPQCKRGFRLTWNDYGERPETLKWRWCPSGGIYDMWIACPHCDYREPL